MPTLAFDVYGTLIDTHGVIDRLASLVPDPMRFSTLWRDKQLEYSFRRGLMHNYVDFATCTAQALDYTGAALGVPLNDAHKQDLLLRYQNLPAFPEVSEGLARLRAAGMRTVAFSNGTEPAIRRLLKAAGIVDLFEQLISVDDLRTFKPSPAVYAHLLRSTGSDAEGTWMVSSNSFDVLGARSAGLRAAWVRRSEQNLLDPWGIEPTLTVSGLTDLTDRLLG